jgi:CRISPR/Cas system CSM-associated protein Csm3 (group 7 of RAMP superfamily)
LAKPGLPGFSSNSSSQTAQILIGKAMQLKEQYIAQAGSRGYGA